jgi:hypothetical protein
MGADQLGVNENLSKQFAFWGLAALSTARQKEPAAAESTSGGPSELALRCVLRAHQPKNELGLGKFPQNQSE